MSSFQSFSNSYHSNHVADDSSTVFDADTVTPDEVPSLPAMPPLPMLTATSTATVTATTDYLYNNNVTMISSSPHSSQKESPQSFTSELLRRINSQRSLAMPSTATATATRDGEISTNQSSSSSSKKRSITNSSSHSSRKKTRRSSRLKRQQPQDQSYADKSDSEVEDENEPEDYEPAVINQSSSSPTSAIKLTKRELKWKSKFEELCDYKRLHENANVPASNKQLGVWVGTQRQEYRKLKDNKHSCMTNERIEMLESIGFEWVSPIKGSGKKDESRWNKHFNELKAYKEEYNDTDVPQNFKDNKQLGAWVSTQRTQYKKFQEKKKSSMTPERVDLLNSIGFEWVSPNKGRNESKWNERFNELSEFKKVHGHTNVSKSGQDNKQLGEWVSTQRTQYKNFQKNRYSTMTPERVEMLNSIGFEWVFHSRPEWNERFTELKAYKELHGHTNVSTYDEDNKELGTWVSTQRAQYKKFQANRKSAMTPERVDLLNSIDFEWVSHESSWNERFNELKDYKEKYGRTNVPQDFKDNKELGKWVNQQRVQYKKMKANEKSSMTPERMQILESIGFQWSCRPDPAP